MSSCSVTSCVLRQYKAAISWTPDADGKWRPSVGELSVMPRRSSGVSSIRATRLLGHARGRVHA
jgi:hypothetical protein